MDDEDEFLKIGDDEEEERKLNIVGKFADLILDIFCWCFFNIGKIVIVSLILCTVYFVSTTDVVGETNVEEYKIIDKEVNEWFFNTYYIVIDNSGDKEAIRVSFKAWLEYDIGDNYTRVDSNIRFVSTVNGAEIKN